MTNSRGSAPDRFRDITLGHGPTRHDALRDACALAGREVEVVADCEIAGAWTVLARPTPARTHRLRPAGV